jgi:hypothetical protein
VSNGRRPVTRGVARRNAKLAALRALVSKDRAIVAVDLAGHRQAVVVCDHDSVVLARRMFTGTAWCISAILAWAEPLAQQAGFSGVVLACEPTGHRWKPLVVTARAGMIPAVCVQPLLVRRAREGEDFTRSRSGFGDAVIIARLTAELRCYLPYLPEGPWARLRHLGARREGLIGRCVAAREQVRDLLECAWPAVVAGARGGQLSRVGEAQGRAVHEASWSARASSEANNCSRWSWCLARASSCWACRMGRNSMLVWKKVQVSQIDSNAQSSSAGRVQ